jgi:probable HAF family extracellular repeat protein
MIRMGGGRKVLFIGLGSVFFLVLLGLFQNFGETGKGYYEYTVVDIGNLGGPLEQSIPYGINDKGYIVGQSHNKEGQWHAFLWTPKNGMTDLGTLGGSESRAITINSNDEVFGESYDKKGKLKRFQWKSGVMKDMGEAEDGKILFDEARIVGLAPSQSGSTQHAAIWQNGRMLSLGTLGGHYSMARAISAKGDIAGEAENTARLLRPVLWKKESGKITAQDLFSSIKAAKLEGRALSLNDNGEVVGQANTANNSYAFIWSRETGVRDLNQLVRDSDPEFPKRLWVFNKALAVNNCGQVAGEGTLSDLGSGRTFLLTPLEGQQRCKQ